MYCENCKVEVETDTGTCPLCHEKLEKSTERIYPPRSKMIGKDTLSIFTKIYFFTAVVITGIVGLINYVTMGRFTWSVIVFAGILYSFVLIRNTIIAHSNVSSKLFLQAVFMCILLYIIDANTKTGSELWSLNYAIPFVIVSTTVTSTLVAVFNLKKWRDYTMYVFVNLLLGVTPIILSLFTEITVLWPSILSCMFSAFVLIGMLLFYKKKLTNELKKNFHI